ncbi:MAG: hypothetical protein ACO1OB_25685 [Archangium sp.]
MHEVEFEQRRLDPGVIAQSIPPAQEGMKRLLNRARIVRAVIVLLGAASIAFGTQRAGIPLGGALCLFFGALPVLWIGGWLIGFITQARRAARKLNANVGSSEWQAKLKAATTIEKVKLSFNESGITVTRHETTKLTGWNRVRIERINAGELAIHYQPEFADTSRPELLNLPSSAFPTTEAFDTFCLEMQKLVWAAQR